MSDLWRTNGHKAELGEGPVWDPESEAIITVDIIGKKVFYWQLLGETLTLSRVIETGTYVGAAIPLGAGGLVTCEAEGLFFRNAAGGILDRFDVPGLSGSMRINDAKVSPFGTIWLGVMDVDADAGEGSLWQVNREGASTKLLEGLTIPNGMDWWEDRFWFVDGPRQEITCYRLNDGLLGEVTQTIETPGIPDGLTIDRAGRIWVALWGEGKVVCLSQDGKRLGFLDVPTPHSTSVCFFGKRLEHLAITSARVGLSDKDLDRYSHSGELFVKWNTGEGRLASRFTR